MLKNDREIEMLTVKDIQIFLKISRPKAYELVKSKGFPKIVIGRDIRIDKNDFFAWIEKLKKEQYDLSYGSI